MIIAVNSISKKEQRFFDLAKAVAKTSNYHGTHVGCCVVYKGVAVSIASNCEKTHPLQSTYNRFRGLQDTASKLHAEIHALSLIMNRRLDWKQASIFVYRELKNGKPAVSRPCEACSQLIKDLGIQYIYYIDQNCNYIKERII